MNERIKKLAEHVVGPSRLFGGEFALMGDKQVEQFAELIGRECLSIVDSIRDECDKDGESQQALGAAWVGLAIARHFGVE